MAQIFKKRNQKTGEDGWGMSVTIDNRYYRRWFATKREAEDFIKVRRAEKNARVNGLPMPVTHKQRTDVTLLDLWEAFEADALYQSKEPGYQRALFRNWGTFISVVGNLHLRKIKAEHLRQFAAHLLEEFPNQTTSRHYFTQVMTVLNAARELFPDTHSDFTPPAIALKRVGFRHKFQRRNRLITPQELITIYRGLQSPEGSNYENAEERRNHVADFWACLFLIPKRENEWIGLEWSDVDFKGAGIEFTITKTGDVQTLPMTLTVRSILERRRKLYPRPFPADWYVPESGNIRHHRFGHPIKRVCEKHSIPYGDRTPNGLVPHDLRHTAGTLLAQNQIDTPTIGSILAHELGYGATPIYLHSNEAQQRLALQVLHDLWLKYCRDIDGV